MIEQKREDEHNKIWMDYQRGKSYLEQKGLIDNIPFWLGFYEGWGMWPDFEDEDADADLPRPRIPMTKMIVDTKVSNILGAPVKLNFIADNDRVKTAKFTNFAHYQCKEMGMDNIDFEAVLCDRKKGIFIKYYYWSEEAIGRKGRVEGGLRCQLIDPLNFYCSDPNEKDIQKQEWIMILTREDADKVKEMCDSDEARDLVSPNELESPYLNRRELDNSNLCTVLTKFFRIDGEVYFQKATEQTIITKDPVPLNPIPIYQVAKLKAREDKVYKHGEEGYDIEDGKTNTTADEKLEKSDSWERKDYYMASLYPVDTCSLDPSDDSIYGMSEIEDLVVTQQIINFNIAMGTLNLQALSAPKILVKPNALNGQVITNEVGQVVTDYSNMGTTWGILPMQVTPYTAQALQFAPALLDLVRTVKNATETITGDMLSKDMSGVAIAQLQAQQRKPIEMQQKRFWQHKEREGKILEMFYKLFYEKKQFAFKHSFEERVGYYQQNHTMLDEMGTDLFNGEEYQDTSFSIVVEAGAGTQFSEIQAMQMLDNLLMNKFIDLKCYVELYPDSAMPFKPELKEYIFMQEQSEIAQTRQLLDGYVKKNAELNETVKALATQNQEYEKELKSSTTINSKMQEEYNGKLQAISVFLERLFGGGESKGEGQNDSNPTKLKPQLA